LCQVIYALMDELHPLRQKKNMSRYPPKKQTPLFIVMRVNGTVYGVTISCNRVRFLVDVALHAPSWEEWMVHNTLEVRAGRGMDPPTVVPYTTTQQRFYISTHGSECTADVNNWLINCLQSTPRIRELTVMMSYFSAAQWKLVEVCFLDDGLPIININI
jgi:hypothetical protein